MTHTTTATTDPVVTKSMLEENNKQLTESISTKIINEVSELFRDFGDRVDDRFNKIETRLDKIEADIRELTSRVDGLDENMTTLSVLLIRF